MTHVFVNGVQEKEQGGGGGESEGAGTGARGGKGGGGGGGGGPEHRYWDSPRLGRRGGKRGEQGGENLTGTTHRLGHDMGVAVFGHWGPPLLAFPTSHGDEWELQRNGVTAIAEFIDAGRVKLFCVGSNNHESFLNSSAHRFTAAGASACSTSTSATRSSRSSTPLPDRPASRSRRWARRSARITRPTRSSAIRTGSNAATRCRASTTCDGSWTGCTTTTSTSTTRWTTSPTSAIRGSSGSWAAARSAWPPGPDRGKKAASHYDVGDPRAQGHQPSPRRLGAARRPRLAVLEGSDARVSVALVGRSAMAVARVVESIEQILTLGDHLLVVYPDVAPARQDVDVRARRPVRVRLASVGSPNAICTPGTFSSCSRIPIISRRPRFVPKASSPTRSLLASVWQ